MKTRSIIINVNNHCIIRVIEKTRLHYTETLYFDGKQVLEIQHKTLIGKFLTRKMTKIENMQRYYKKFKTYKKEFTSSGWDHHFSFDIDIKFLELLHLIRLEIEEEKKNE